MRLARDALQRSEESAELLAEKSMVAEQVIIISILSIIIIITTLSHLRMLCNIPRNLTIVTREKLSKQQNCYW